MDWNNVLMKRAGPIVKKLKARPEVVAIAFGGSVGGRIADEHSDTDMTAFVTKVPDKKARKRLLGKYKGYFGTDLIDILGEKRIDVYWQDIEILKGSLKRFLEKNQWDEVTAHRLNNIRVIYDPKGILKALISQTRPYPKWMYDFTFDRIAYSRHSSDVIEKALKRCNWLIVDKMLYDAVANIAHGLYGLNSTYFTQEYWQRWFPRDMKRFKVLPPHAYERMEEIMHLNNRSDLIEKVEAINSLANDIEKLYKKRGTKFSRYQSRARAERNIRKLKKTYSELRFDL